MHHLWKIPRLFTLWGNEISCRTFHMNIKKLIPIQWGHQEAPAKFNFASDVIDHWASVEKAGKRSSGPALWWMNGSGKEIKWSFRELSEASIQGQGHCGWGRSSSGSGCCGP
ncbi:acyl-CoA synthetase medium-chain family member 2, isoform CRA_d [Mus musculus]|nr:acyl-CoA synthetase medium-chain family member 2, isoform CRA_d [Mus musculus]